MGVGEAREDVVAEGVAVVAPRGAHEELEEVGVVEAVEGLVEVADAGGDVGGADEAPDDAVRVAAGGGGVLVALVVPGLFAGEVEDVVLDGGV